MHTFNFFKKAMSFLFFSCARFTGTWIARWNLKDLSHSPSWIMANLSIIYDSSTVTLRWKMPKLDKIAKKKKKKKSFCLSGTILFVNKKKTTDNKKQSIAKFVLFHPKIISLNPPFYGWRIGQNLVIEIQ